MHAIVVHEGGGPDVLNFEEVPDPAANGKVLVKVEAAAVNHFDNPAGGTRNDWCDAALHAWA